MKKLEENDLILNIGKKIIVVEMVTNDEREIGFECYWLCETIKEAEETAVEMNKHNQDKNYKYIVVEYTVQEDLSLEV